MSGKQWTFAGAAAALALGGLFAAWRGRFAPRGAASASTHLNDRSDYVDPAACTGCHQDIAKSYKLTGMGRSWHVPASTGATENYPENHSFYNKISDRYYSLTSRDGKLYQRRHQIGFDGKETNVVEKEVDYVVGSGNHARTYLTRTSQGQLVELPVSWYAEKGGEWAMSPGFDRPNQPDFVRTVSTDCMDCHNGYPAPDQSPRDASADPIFGDRIPQGIDCQRCHGPGRAHVQAAGSGKATPEAIRKAIVNPKRLARDRQLEVCMQCHLETTSRDLPGAIEHYEQPPFSYRPGQALGDYVSYFDHAPGTGHDDKFEIAHAAYRLRKSQCFLQSEMTCTTCHNPHAVPRGAQASQQYVAVCKSCHAAAHAAEMPAKADCIGCHMPRRRADDAVHTVLTDHYIQRRKPARDLLATLRETDLQKLDTYRGPVIPYYPPQSGSSPESEFYTAVAQVRDSANLEAGTPRLQQDLEKDPPASPRFYFELAEAYSKQRTLTDAIHWYREALRHDPAFRPAMASLATALISAGQLPEAASLLEKAAAAPPADPAVLTNLGIVYLKQGNPDRAAQMFRQALNINPDAADADNLLGSVLQQQGDLGAAEQFFRHAISMRPELTEPHYNLANLLARNGRYPESAFQFEKAIAAQPDYAEAHRNFGNLLTLTRSYDKARVELETAVRQEPGVAQAHSDLADALILTRQLDRGIEEYRSAIQLNPDLYEAHLALGIALARSGKFAEAQPHFVKAAQSPDPDVRQAALRASAPH